MTNTTHQAKSTAAALYVACELSATEWLLTMSRATDARAIVDAGLKASSVDSGMPTVWQRPDLTYVKAADEHGVVATPGAAPLSLGDVLMLVPGHCDPTVNLYDELVCFRGDRVEALWPIAARGALL